MKRGEWVWKGYGGFVFCVEVVLCGEGKVVENDRKAEFGMAMEDRSDGVDGWIVCGFYKSGGFFRQ